MNENIQIFRDITNQHTKQRNDEIYAEITRVRTITIIDLQYTDTLLAVSRRTLTKPFELLVLKKTSQLWL